MSEWAQRLVERVRGAIIEALQEGLRPGPSDRREAAAGIAQLAEDLHQTAAGKIEDWDELFREDLGGPDIRRIK